MRHVLNKFFANSLRSEKQKINLLFMTFLVAYTLRACFSIFYKYYELIVCQLEVRWILNGIFRFFFMYTAMASMLWFHH